MRRGDVFITYHTTSVATALECVQNRFYIGASYFNRIMQNRHRNPFCKQRTEFEPTQDVSFMAYTIDKEVFLRNFSIHYTYYSSTR